MYNPLDYPRSDPLPGYNGIVPRHGRCESHEINLKSGQAWSDLATKFNSFVKSTLPETTILKSNKNQPYNYDLR